MRMGTKLSGSATLVMICLAASGTHISAKPAKKEPAPPKYTLCTSAEEIIFNFNAPQTSPGSVGFPDDNGNEMKPFLGKDLLSVCLNRTTSKLRLSAAENGQVRLDFTPSRDSKFRFVDASGMWSYLCFKHRNVAYVLRVYTPADRGAEFSVIGKDGNNRDFFSSYGNNPTWKGKKYWYLSDFNLNYLLPNGKTMQNEQRLSEIFFEPGVKDNFSDFAFSENNDYESAVCGKDSFG